MAVDEGSAEGGKLSLPLRKSKYIADAKHPTAVPPNLPRAKVDLLSQIVGNIKTAAH